MCLNTFSFPLFCLNLIIIFSFPLFCLNLIIIFSFPLFGLTFLVIYMIYAVLFSCLCKHHGVQFCQQDPVTIVDDISVATDGREPCLLAHLVQRAGKWFSSSLALGIDVVADITDRLLSNTPYYRDRERCRPLPTFNPHGGPITHSSTGSRPDSPIHPVVEVVEVIPRAWLRI